MNAAKKILFIIRTAPYATLQIQEAVDMLLAAAAFDQQVSLLFMDDGVYHLLSHQHPAEIFRKNLQPVFSSLSLFDIHEVGVDKISLLNRGLDTSELFLPVNDLSVNQLAAILAKQHLILSF